MFRKSDLFLVAAVAVFVIAVHSRGDAAVSDVAVAPAPNLNGCFEAVVPEIVPVRVVIPLANGLLHHAPARRDCAA